MRLVDFAHTEAATTLDENYLFGLGTLVEMLEGIAREGRSTSHVYENQRCTRRQSYSLSDTTTHALIASNWLLDPRADGARCCIGTAETAL